MIWENGLLGHCSRSVIARKVQLFQLPLQIKAGKEGGGYVPVSRSGEFKELLSEYISNPHYMEACRYCNGTDPGASVEPQSN